MDAQRRNNTVPAEQKTVKEAVADIFTLASVAPPKGRTMDDFEAIDQAVVHALTRMPEDFTDVQSLAWLAARFMRAALEDPSLDMMVKRACLLNAHLAIQKVAAEMGVADQPPGPPGKEKGLQ